MPDSRTDAETAQQQNGIADNSQHDKIVVQIVKKSDTSCISQLKYRFSDNSAIYSIEASRCQIGLRIKISLKVGLKGVEGSLNGGHGGVVYIYC